MTASNTSTVTDGRDDNTSLTELGSVVTTALAFAEKWPEAYRPRVFNLAVDRLMSTGPVGVSPKLGSAPAPTIATGSLGVVAREIDVDPELLARVVAIDGEGKVAILGRIDARAKADLAMQYAAVFCYIKERALNQLDTPIEELRALAKAHGCYDSANFTAAFRRSDLLRELGEAGSHSRTYRLSAKGLDEAKVLLKKMVET